MTLFYFFTDFPFYEKIDYGGLCVVRKQMFTQFVKTVLHSIFS